MSVRILVGDVLERLAQLPDESVHCVVTSPPYWGLRDHGTDGQLGLEATPEEHVERMVGAPIVGLACTLNISMRNSWAS